MLQLFIPKSQYWDEKKEEFVYIGKDITLKLEHSLISISKWESKWHVPFFETDMTKEMAISYIECMTLNPDVDASVYSRITTEHVKLIKDYIQDPMTASKITERRQQQKQHEYMTSELIYYLMIQYGIPVEFEKWHINRLIMLIKICDVKNNSGSKSSKMTQSELLQNTRAINEARRASAKAKRKV